MLHIILRIVIICKRYCIKNSDRFRYDNHGVIHQRNLLQYIWMWWYDVSSIWKSIRWQLELLLKSILCCLESVEIHVQTFSFDNFRWQTHKVASKSNKEKRSVSWNLNPNIALGLSLTLSLSHAILANTVNRNLTGWGRVIEQITLWIHYVLPVDTENS